MEDAQRFLRYVIPGLVLIIEVFLYLLVSSHLEFGALVIRALSDSIGTPVLVFIASGGIGFCLANIYHYIYWKSWFRFLVIDHQQLLKELEKREWLILRQRADGEEISFEWVQSKKNAWLLANVFWYTGLSTSQRIREAAKPVYRLVDIMHSLGSTLVGSAVAIPLWLVVHYLLATNLQFKYLSIGFYFTIPLAAIVFFMHLDHYRKVVKDFQFMSNTIATDAAREQVIKYRSPVILNISRSELENKEKYKLRIHLHILFLVSVACICLGLVYFFLPNLMPYRKEVVDIINSQLRTSAPTLFDSFNSLYRGVGILLMTIGIVTGVLFKEPRIKKGKWIWWAVLVLSLVALIILFPITLSVDVHGLWVAVGTLIILVIGAMILEDSPSNDK